MNESREPDPTIRELARVQQQLDVTRLALDWCTSQLAGVADFGGSSTDHYNITQRAKDIRSLLLPRQTTSAEMDQFLRDLDTPVLTIRGDATPEQIAKLTAAGQTRSMQFVADTAPSIVLTGPPMTGRCSSCGADLDALRVLQLEVQRTHGENVGVSHVCFPNEQSDRDRGEVIKRAMIALEGCGIPNDVGDPDEMNMLSARIRELGKRRPLRPVPLIVPDVPTIIEKFADIEICDRCGNRLGPNHACRGSIQPRGEELAERAREQEEFDNRQAGRVRVPAIAANSVLDDREFYELLQAYRRCGTQMVNVADAEANIAFHAIKTFILRHFRREESVP